MPLWLPPSFPGRYLTSSGPVTVTAGGTAHTKGSWTELVASTPEDAYGLYVMLSDVAVADTSTAMLVDVGVGAAGSETVLIPDLNAGAAVSRVAFGKRAFFPIYVRKGSRISARAQAQIASDTVTVDLFLYGDPPSGGFVGSKVTAYGVDAANSRGTVIAGANSWTQVTASTSEPHVLWYVMMGLAGGVGQSNDVLTNEIGFGASGSEVAFAKVLSLNSLGEDVRGFEPPIPVYRSLAAGTRIAVRQSDTLQRDAVVYAVS